MPPCRHWYRLTDLAPAGKIPLVREIRALLWLHGLDRALTTLQEDALAVWLIDQGKAVPVLAQARVLLDEIMLGHPEEPGYPADLAFGDFDKTRPAAAIRASLTLVVNGFAHTGAVPCSISFMSASTMICTSSLKRTFGSQPSFSFALAGLPMRRSTSAGRS